MKQKLFQLLKFYLIQAAVSRDFNGNLPFHVAAEHQSWCGHDVTVVITLYALAPQAIMIENSNQQRPFQICRG